MAKLNKKLAELESAIDRLAEGDIATPITQEGISKYGNIYKSLDRLRVSMAIKESDATEKERKIEQTVSSVTHDLKTPIALIAGYAECLEDGMDDKEYSTLIRNGALEMNETVLKILDAAKQKPEDSSYNLREFVLVKPYFTKTLEKYASIAQEKGITFKTTSLIGKEYIFIAPKEFETVLENLLSNAIKFTPKGGKVKVTFTKIFGFLNVTVKNSGEGIKADDLPHVFEKYFTEDKARTHGGTGLGLAIAKEKVEAFGGKITVRSKEDKGATFTFCLPCYGNQQLSHIRDGKDGKECNKWIAWALCFFLGYFGAHKYYEGHYALGVLYSLTFGLFVFGWLTEIFIYLTHPNPYYA